MALEFIMLNGYGQFVWPAFIFTFVCCFYLYLITKKEFIKQEKKFLTEFKQEQTLKINSAREKNTIKEVLSSNANY